MSARLEYKGVNMKFLLLCSVAFLAIGNVSYDTSLKRYEVSGVVLEEGKGTHLVATRHFRTHRRAWAYYEKCRNKYFSAYMHERI